MRLVNRLYIGLLLTASAAFAQYPIPGSSGGGGGGGGGCVAGTGITCVGSTISVDTAVIESRETAQSGASTKCVSATGSATMTCALTPTLTAYEANMCLVLNSNFANVTTATLDVDALGVKSVLNRSGAALAAGDIPLNKPVGICYDGTQWIVQGGSGSASVANAFATSVGAVTSLAIDITALNVADLSQTLVQCWTGASAPFTEVAITSLNPASLTSITANFSSTANVTCRVNATGAAGSAGATGATGAAGPGPVYTTTSYSATPTFTVSASGIQGFFITLTGNVTSSTLSTGSATTGQDIWFNICQDGSGSRTFVWPTNVLGGGTIRPAASTCSRQLFRWDGTNANAVSLLTSTGMVTTTNYFGIGTATPAANLDILTARTPATGTGGDFASRVQWAAPFNATNFIFGQQALLTNSGSTVGTSGHGIALFGESFDTTAGAISMYGTEGRVEGRSTIAVPTHTYIGVLGIMNYENPGGTNVMGPLNGMQSRCQITSDGTTPIAQGTCINYFSDPIVGGAYKRSFYGDDTAFFGSAIIGAGGGFLSPGETLHIEDKTAMTGTTTVGIKGGAGDSSSTYLMNFRDNADALGGFIRGDGAMSAFKTLSTFDIASAALDQGFVTGGTGLKLRDTAQVIWSSTGAWYGTPDLSLSRYAANVLAVGTGAAGNDGGTVRAATFIGALTGNASTATALETARTIAGVSFDGSANIAIASTGLSDTANLVRNNAANTWSTGAQVFTAATLRVPNSTSLPGTCTVGDSYMDTDATSGARWYLCESTNTWAAQGGGGSGTVTSVGWTGGIVSIATATTTPAFTIAGTSGGIPYFSSASTWASSAALASTGVVLGGGAGAAPTATTALTYASGQFTNRLDQNGATRLIIDNQTAGTAAQSSISLTVDGATADIAYFGLLSPSYTTSGGFMADSFYIATSPSVSNGLNIMARDTGGEIRLYTGGSADSNQKVLIDSTGQINMGQQVSTNIVSNVSLGLFNTTAATGRTRQIIQAGAGQSTTSLWELRDYNATLGSGALLLSVSSAGRIVTAAGNETTGAGTPLLGTNSPAVTNTAPYTWIRFTTSDGSAVFIPAWK